MRQYLVEKSVKGTNEWERVATVESYKTHQVASGLVPDKEYVFAVSAENDVGKSERCETAKPIKLDKPISM